MKLKSFCSGWTYLNITPGLNTVVYKKTIFLPTLSSYSKVTNLPMQTALKILNDNTYIMWQLRPFQILRASFPHK